jgi:TP901 family phage tail tape measure protein
MSGISSTATLNVRANTAPMISDVQAAVRRLQNINIGVNVKNNALQPLGRITGQVAELNKSLEASNARVLAFGASAGSIYLVQRAISSLISTTIEVQKELANINVLLNLNTKELGFFSGELFGVARNTALSFTVVSKAAAEFSRQGLSMEETLRRTNAALILTRLSGLDAQKSVEALTATINSFADASLDAVEVVNKLANVDAAFAVSSADLANAIQRVGSSAVDAGVSFDELIALVTTAQQITARGGSVIGNSFKTIFTRLQRGKTVKLLESLGISDTDSSGQAKSMITMLKELANTYDRLGSQQKAYVAEQVGGVFQINILKAALGDLSKEYSIFDRALETSLNTTDEAIQRNSQLNETIAALSQRASTNIQKLASTIGNVVFEPNAKSFLSSFNDLFESFDDVKADGFGAKIGRGLLTGIGNFISGPGAILLGAVAVNLFKKFADFARGSFSELLGLNTKMREKNLLQESLLSLLAKEKNMMSELLNGQMSQEQAAQRLKQIFQDQYVVLQQQQKISSSLASSLMGSGVRMMPVGNKGASYPAVKTSSSGYVPKMQEALGAISHGYEPGRVYQTRVHDGAGGSSRSYVNSAEKVINFRNSMGKRATMVVPPNGFGEGTQFASGGFLPNFAPNAFSGRNQFQMRWMASEIKKKGLPPEALNDPQIMMRLAKIFAKKYPNNQGMFGMSGGFVPNFALKNAQRITAGKNFEIALNKAMFGAPSYAGSAPLDFPLPKGFSKDKKAKERLGISDQSMYGDAKLSLNSSNKGSMLDKFLRTPIGKASLIEKSREAKKTGSKLIELNPRGLSMVFAEGEKKRDGRVSTRRRASAGGWSVQSGNLIERLGLDAEGKIIRMNFLADHVPFSRLNSRSAGFIPNFSTSTTNPRYQNFDFSDRVAVLHESGPVVPRQTYGVPLNKIKFGNWSGKGIPGKDSGVNVSFYRGSAKYENFEKEAKFQIEGAVESLAQNMARGVSGLEMSGKSILEPSKLGVMYGNMFEGTLKRIFAFGGKNENNNQTLDIPNGVPPKMAGFFGLPAGKSMLGEVKTGNDPIRLGKSMAAKMATTFPEFGEKLRIMGAQAGAAPAKKGKFGGFIPNFVSAAGLQAMKDLASGKRGGAPGEVRNAQEALRKMGLLDGPISLTKMGLAGRDNLRKLKSIYGSFGGSFALEAAKMGDEPFVRRSISGKFPDSYSQRLIKLAQSPNGYKFLKNIRFYNFAEGFVPNFSYLEDVASLESGMSGRKATFHTSPFPHFRNTSQPTFSSAMKDHGGLKNALRDSAAGQKGAGLLSGGFVPNFAAEDGVAGKEGFDVGAVLLGLQSVIFTMVLMGKNANESTKKLIPLNVALKNLASSKISGSAKVAEAAVSAGKNNPLLQAFNKDKGKLFSQQKELDGLLGKDISKLSQQEQAKINQRINILDQSNNSLRASLATQKQILKSDRNSLAAAQRQVNARKRELSSITSRIGGALKGKGFAIGSAAQMIAPQLGEMFGDDKTAGGRAKKAGFEGIGNIAGLAATGGMLGGPVGAAIGGGAGLLMEVPKIIDAYTSKIPDLEKSVEASSTALRKFSEAAQVAFQALEKAGSADLTSRQGILDYNKAMAEFGDTVNNLDIPDGKEFDKARELRDKARFNVGSGDLNSAKENITGAQTEIARVNKNEGESLALKKVLERGFAQDVGDAFTGAAMRPPKEQQDAIKNYVKATTAASTFFDRSEDGTNQLKEGAPEFASSVAKSLSELNSIANSSSFQAGSVLQQNQRMSIPTIAALSSLGQTVPAIGNSTKEFDEAFKKAAKEISEFKGDGNAQEIIDSMSDDVSGERRIQYLRENLDAFSALSEEVRKSNEAIKRSIENRRRNDDAMSKSKDALNSLSGAVSGASAASKFMTDAFKRINDLKLSFASSSADAAADMSSRNAETTFNLRENKRSANLAITDRLNQKESKPDYEFEMAKKSIEDRESLGKNTAANELLSTREKAAAARDSSVREAALSVSAGNSETFSKILQDQIEKSSATGIFKGDLGAAESNAAQSQVAALATKAFSDAEAKVKKQISANGASMSPEELAALSARPARAAIEEIRRFSATQNPDVGPAASLLQSLTGSASGLDEGGALAKMLREGQTRIEIATENASLAEQAAIKEAEQKAKVDMAKLTDISKNQLMIERQNFALAKASLSINKALSAAGGAEALFTRGGNPVTEQIKNEVNEFVAAGYSDPKVMEALANNRSVRDKTGQLRNIGTESSENLRGAGRTIQGLLRLGAGKIDENSQLGKFGKATTAELLIRDLTDQMEVVKNISPELAAELKNQINQVKSGGDLSPQRLIALESMLSGDIRELASKQAIKEQNDIINSSTASDEQKTEAKETLKALNAEFGDPIVTAIDLFKTSFETIFGNSPNTVKLENQAEASFSEAMSSQMQALNEAIRSLSASVQTIKANEEEEEKIVENSQVGGTQVNVVQNFNVNSAADVQTVADASANRIRREMDDREKGIATVPKKVPNARLQARSGVV